MGHQQPPTPAATDNTAANSIVNRTAKQKISREIHMIFYWVRDQTWQTMSQNTTQYGTTAKRDPDMSKEKKYIKTKHTSEPEPG